ncbi:MAG: cytosine permease, partial [Microcella sp.]
MVDSPASAPDDADSVLPPGPRRSTYTPPTSPASPRSADDDPLADAIAAEYRAWVPINRQPEPPAPSAVGQGAPITPPDNPLAGLSAPEAAPPGAPGPPIPPPPSRASLTDDDLVAVLDPELAGGNTGALIDLFEEQLTLRERELRQLDAWEEQVRRLGVDSADEIVASVRSAYTGVLDVIPPAAVAPRDSTTAPAEHADALPPLAPAPSDVTSADSAPTAPGQVVAPAIDPATLTPNELSAALADAPPPTMAQRTVATPPDDLLDEVDPVPPPLVEPELAEPPSDPLANAPAWDALITASTDGTPATPDAPAASPFTLTPSPSVSASSPAGPPADPPTAAAAPVKALASDSAPATDSAPAAPADSPSAQAPAPAPAPASSPPLAPLAPAPRPPAERVHPPLPSADETPARGPRAFALEQSALEPTPTALRAGRAVRLFWLWFAVNASVVTIALGAILIADGASLRQAVLAALGGVALSSFLLGVITRTGRWSGQPTVVVARATFGTIGNAVPAAVAVLVRVLWASALLFVLGIGVAEVLVEAQLDGGLGRPSLTIIVAAVGFALAAAAALLGFGLIARLGAIIAPLAAILVLGLVALTVPLVDLPAALTIPDGSWALLVGGSVLILSAVGLAWVSSGGDLVRYQSPGASGTAAALWTGLGVALPAFLLVGWGAVLAASNPVIL